MHIGSSLDDLFEEDGTLKEIEQTALDRVNKYITESSGNVFTDLNLPNAEERLIKSRVANKIYNLYVNNKYLGTGYAASILDITHERMEDLIKGKLYLFTVEELNSYWDTLNKAYPNGY